LQRAGEEVLLNFGKCADADEVRDHLYDEGEDAAGERRDYLKKT